MKIKNCLILAAGFGTRMGEIGNYLPKVMWPIYEKKLIDLQIVYAKKLGCEQIFINSHYLHNILEKHLVENHPDVIIIYEKEILDVGGAIHNLARNIDCGKQDRTLLLNGDVLYFMDEKYFECGLKYLEDEAVVIYGVNVGPGYSKIIVEDETLVGIDKPSVCDESYTYSGVSLIDLSKLKAVAGSSKFFETVANYREKRICTIIPEEGEYHDFGTAGRYFSKMFDILSDLPGSKMKLTDFCIETNAINVSNYLGGYGSKNKQIINLSSKKINSSKQVIILNDIDIIETPQAGIYFNQIFQPLHE